MPQRVGMLRNHALEVGPRRRFVAHVQSQAGRGHQHVVVQIATAHLGLELPKPGQSLRVARVALRFEQMEERSTGEPRVAVLGGHAQQARQPRLTLMEPRQPQQGAVVERAHRTARQGSTGRDAVQHHHRALVAPGVTEDLRQPIERLVPVHSPVRQTRRQAIGVHGLGDATVVGVAIPRGQRALGLDRVGTRERRRAARQQQRAEERQARECQAITRAHRRLRPAPHARGASARDRYRLRPRPYASRREPDARPRRPARRPRPRRG